MFEHGTTNEQTNTEEPGILAGYISKQKLAVELGYRSTRSVERLMAIVNGLPYITVCRKPYFDIKRVREWLASREVQRNQTNRSGRRGKRR